MLSNLFYFSYIYIIYALRGVGAKTYIIYALRGVGAKTYIIYALMSN